MANPLTILILNLKFNFKMYLAYYSASPAFQVSKNPA